MRRAPVLYFGLAVLAVQPVPVRVSDAYKPRSKKGGTGNGLKGDGRIGKGEG